MYSNNQQTVIFCQKELKNDVKPWIQDKESVQNVEDWCLRCPMQEGYLQRNVAAGIVSNLPNVTNIRKRKRNISLAMRTRHRN
jgi:hypothetical protein